VEEGGQEKRRAIVVMIGEWTNSHIQIAIQKPGEFGNDNNGRFGHLLATMWKCAKDANFLRWPFCGKGHLGLSPNAPSFWKY
jgi:hypothetical protein